MLNGEKNKLVNATVAQKYCLSTLYSANENESCMCLIGDVTFLLKLKRLFLKSNEKELISSAILWFA